MSQEARRIQAEYTRRSRVIPPDRYAAIAPENMQARHERERLTVAALRRDDMLPLNGRRVLDVGCGAGSWLAAFAGWGADESALAGLDLMEDRAAAAARRLPAADVRQGDATHLPWADASFDVVFQSMMFSSVLDDGMRMAIAREMRRVLAPGGAVVWYDFFVSHPRNPHVRGVRSREIALLFEGFDIRLRRATLAPPLARAIMPRWYALGAVLSSLRLLDTHYIGTLRPGA